MGSQTENIIDTLFNTILNKLQQAMETSCVGLLYYPFQRIDMKEVNHI